jgi:uncharacterized SAM-binding protein YcdF (DUF218 family)
MPPNVLIIVLVISLVLVARGRRRPGLVLGAAATAALFLLSTQVVGDALIRPLEERYAPMDFSPAVCASQAGPCQAAFRDAPVVVLGGGTIDRSPEEGMAASLADEPTKRLTYGIRVARALGRRLVYSGGRVYDGPGIETEAAGAARFIERDGSRVEAVFEDQSRTTLENARLVAAKTGARAVILVTSAYHMPRSVQSFRKAGLEVLPAPTDYKASRSPHVLVDFTPTIGGLETSYKALHEYAGMLGYALAR